MTPQQLAEVSIKAINAATIPASEAENVVAAKQWLMKIYNGEFTVDEKKPPESAANGDSDE